MVLSKTLVPWRIVRMKNEKYYALEKLIYKVVPFESYYAIKYMVRSLDENYS